MSPSSPQQAEAGVVIGGYELVRRLGRGGMAEVWVARRSLGQKGSKFVAIKLIADHYVGDERYARMFRAEAELAALLSHANIVQVFDEGEEDGRSYLVMEWVDGLNLLKLGAVLALLDDDERRWRIIAYTIGQLLYALGYAHSITSHDGSPLGVVHRDVSPQNVMVSNHGEVKLTDFGVAFQTMEESSGIHVKGKVRYMSPEQLGGKTRSPTVDLYAVGALLHELLDGKKFRGEYDDGQDLFSIVLSGEIPPLSRPAPPELDELRLRLLAPDPTERIQTAEEAIEWLKQFPGYGDARGELAKLCNSLTGVVRPRAGPGQSGLVRMADRRKGLARPQVNPRPTVPRPKPMSQPTSSTTAVKSPRPAVPIITGQTEFVRPQQPSGLGKKRVFTTPTLLGADAASASGSPGHGAGAVHPAVPPHIETPAPPSASNLASPAPYLVHEQPSHPIPVHADAAAPYAPTERLGPSETSGMRPPSNRTEVLDPNMIIEVTSGSGTDQEILPQVVLRDGTDTSREIRPQAVAQQHSISIVLPRRSALAAIGVGLVMVALLSVSVTWWLFTRNKSIDAQVVAHGEAPSVPASAAGAVLEPIEETKEVLVADLPSPVPAPSLEGPDESSAVELTAESTTAQVGEADETGEVPSGSPVDDAAVEEEPEGSAALDALDSGDDAVEPPANDDPSPVEPEPNPSAERVGGEPSGSTLPAPKKKEKATLVINALPGMVGAQIKVGSRVLTVSDGRKIISKIPPGTTRFAWRKNESAKGWTQAPSLSLRPGKTTKLLLTASGLKEL